MPFIAIALVIAAAIGGGATVASQNALPNDALWGFKVNVTENVQSAFSFGDKAKADWNIAILQVRLDEAAKLAAEGKLNASAQAKIESNFNARAEAVAAHIERLEEKGNYAAAAEVAARFQATVARHAAALAEASANASVNAQPALGAIINKVQATLDVASDLSAEASAKAAAQGNSDADYADGTTTIRGNANVNANVNIGGNTSSGGAGASGSGSAEGGIQVEI